MPKFEVGDEVVVAAPGKIVDRSVATYAVQFETGRIGLDHKNIAWIDESEIHDKTTNDWRDVAADALRENRISDALAILLPTIADEVVQQIYQERYAVTGTDIDHHLRDGMIRPIVQRAFELLVNQKIRS